VSGFPPSSTQALIDLDAIPHDDWDKLLEECLRVTSSVLGIAIASYWRFRDHPPSIICELGYQALSHRFERGFTLAEHECPNYLEQVRRTHVLAIEDAAQDQRTCDLRSYLIARGIGALLDTAVRVGGVPVGILCHEHKGGPRAWSPEEQHFAFAAGQTLGARLESRARSRAEKRERRSALLVDAMADVEECFTANTAASLAVERALPALGDLATLVTFDGDHAWHVVGAHVDSSKRALLDELLRRYSSELDGPGLAARAIRERHSILLPSVTSELARSFGLPEDEAERLAALRVRSAIATPFTVRGETSGAMVFASSSHCYDQDDLRFAEVYAQRIGLILENGQLYQTARQAILIRDEFLSLASHELRTPLTILRLSAEKLSREVGAQPAAGKLATRIVRQSDRLDRLVERLLNASDIGAGRPSIRRERTDLNAIVADVVQSYGQANASAESPVTLSVGPPVTGEFDPIRLEQALGNLIDNAIKFGRGAPIDVSVGSRDAMAVIAVHDQGPGIPPEERSQIFRPYWRGQMAHGIGGLGLGLHVVQQIVEAHGGKVRVESEPTFGTTFTVELPLLVPRADIASA
jgi:signal transduction histidine kinase